MTGKKRSWVGSKKDVQKRPKTVQPRSNHFQKVPRDVLGIIFTMADNWHSISVVSRQFLEAFKHFVDPSMFHNRAFRWACAIGSTSAIKSLLSDPRVDPTDQDNDALYWGCEKGNPEVVSLLLQDERINPASNNYNCLSAACDSKSSEVLKILLRDRRVNPSSVFLGGLLNRLAKAGSADLLRVLTQMKRSIIKHQDIQVAIKIATQHGHTAAGRVLKSITQQPSRGVPIIIKSTLR